MKIGIVAENAVINNKYIYVFAQNVNLLLGIDLATGNVNAMGSIPEETFFTQFLVGGLVFYNNKIFLTPHCAKSMWTFDVCDNKWEKIELDGVASSLDRKFNASFLFKGKIYMMGFYYPGILVYDPEKKKCQKRTVFDDLNVENVNNEGFIRKNCYIKGDSLYAPSLFSNKVLKFNLDNYSWRWIELKTNQQGFSGITYDGKEFILSPKYFDNRIVIWNEVEEKCIEHTVGNKTEVYLGAFYIGGKVIIPGKEGSKTILYHNNNFDIDKRSFFMFDVKCMSMFMQDYNGCFSAYENGEKIIEKRLFVDINENIINIKNDMEQIFFEKGFGFDLESYLSIVCK